MYRGNGKCMCVIAFILPLQEYYNTFVFEAKVAVIIFKIFPTFSSCSVCVVDIKDKSKVKNKIKFLMKVRQYTALEENSGPSS